MKYKRSKYLLLIGITFSAMGPWGVVCADEHPQAIEVKAKIVAPLPAFQRVSRYVPILESCIPRGQKNYKFEPFLAIRKFMQSGQRKLLLVNPVSLEGSSVLAREYTCKSIDTVPSSKYSKLLEKNLQFVGAPIQNNGVKSAFNLAAKGYFLTLDLCPVFSDAQFEHALFELLGEVARNKGAPVAVGIAITGSWLRKHTAEFSLLLSLRDQKLISIAWINHSNHHKVLADVPEEENFLLAPGTNLDEEILGLEQALLGYGEIPSVFFRFPGLVSNDAWIKKLASLHLVPLGADAWLGKNQKPKLGSIILLHGNGNEPIGVTRFIKRLPELLKHGFFLPLSDLID